MFILLLFPPELFRSRVVNPAVSLVALAIPHQNVDADSNLDAKDIVRRAREFRVLSDVAAQIQDKSALEVTSEMFAHPVGCNPIQKSTVSYKCDDAFCA